MPTGYVTTPLTELGLRLRALRMKPRRGRPEGYTQEELAVMLNTKANRISDWEIGKHIPSLPLLERIAAVHGITVAKLLRGVM